MEPLCIKYELLLTLYLWAGDEKNGEWRMKGGKKSELAKSIRPSDLGN